MWAIGYFHPYLFGRRFSIKTDHSPLVWLSSLKKPNSKIQRWKIKLNEFDFDITYTKSKGNVIADGLCRITTVPDDQMIVNLSEIFEDDICTVFNPLDAEKFFGESVIFVCFI